MVEHSKRKKFHDKDKYYRCEFLSTLTCVFLCYCLLFCSFLFKRIVLLFSLIFMFVFTSSDTYNKYLHSGQRTGLSFPCCVQIDTNQPQILRTAKCQNSTRFMCRPRWMDAGLFALPSQQSLYNHCCCGYFAHPPNEECHHSRWGYYH